MNLSANTHLPVIRIPEHLSVSQMRTLLNCGWRWAYEHPEGERGIDVGWSARLRGSCLDIAASEHFRQKAVNGSGITLAQIKEIADYEHRRAEDATNFEMPVSKSRDRLIKQAEVYWQTFGQQFSPRSVDDVQKTVTYKDDDLAVPIVGIIDLVADVPMIVDTKIKGRLPKEQEVHRDWQLTTYAMMLNVSSVALAIVTDENYPRAELMVSMRTQNQINAIKASYNAAWQTILAGAFLPAPEGHWSCNSRWCPHHRYCPMGAANELEIFTIPGIDE